MSSVVLVFGRPQHKLRSSVIGSLTVFENEKVWRALKESSAAGMRIWFGRMFGIRD